MIGGARSPLARFRRRSSSFNRRILTVTPKSLRPAICDPSILNRSCHLGGNSHPLAGAPGLSLWRLGRTRTRSWAKSENKMARSSVVERIRFRSMGSCWHRVPSVGTLNCVNSNSTLCGSGSKRVCVEHGLMSRVGGLSQSPRRSA